MPNIWIDGTVREMTEAEAEAWKAALETEEMPTELERLQHLEQTKADRTDVDELNEALEMILTGVTE